MDDLLRENDELRKELDKRNRQLASIFGEALFEPSNSSCNKSSTTCEKVNSEENTKTLEQDDDVKTPGYPVKIHSGSYNFDPDTCNLWSGGKVVGKMKTITITGNKGYFYMDKSDGHVYLCLDDGTIGGTFGIVKGGKFTRKT
jgi:hypothetical protein